MRLEELNNIPDLHDKAINHVFEQGLVKDDGLWLEFGVYAGGTINRIARYTNHMVYGFDSFEGLPETWQRRDANGVTYPKGTFSLGGRLPQVAPNVVLIKGWYKDTLPTFLANTPGPVSFLHVDSDIYSSARDILTHLAPRIGPGCMIVFDELVGYNGFEHNEWKAWWEFVDANKIEFEWIGGNRSTKMILPQLPEGQKRFDYDRPPTENVSPAAENVAVRIVANPSFKGANV